MVFRDLHLSEDLTAPHYCEYSLTKSLHCWNKGFLPHFMDRNQNYLGKKITKDNRKKVYPVQSLIGIGQKSSNTFRILLQPSATWVSQGFPQAELVCLHLLVLHGKQVFNPG